MIAVIIPSRNQALTIRRVVTGFRAALPDATVFVYDANSSDGSAAAASAAGAVVRGAGRCDRFDVIRRAFADIEADVYVLADGDDTCDASLCPAMIRLMLQDRFDMVAAARAQGALRTGLRFANRMLGLLVLAVPGGVLVADMLSEYRVFSRRFVKSSATLSRLLPTGTAFTLHALEQRMAVGELPTGYREPAPDVAGKLRARPGGGRILLTLLVLVKDQRPLLFFSLAGWVLLAGGLGLAASDFTGHRPGFGPASFAWMPAGCTPGSATSPGAAAVGLMLLALLSFACGLLLEAMASGRREARRLAYLSMPAPGA